MSNYLSVSRLSELELPDIGSVWLSIKLPNSHNATIIFGIYYRPPGQTLEQRTDFIASFTKSVETAFLLHPHLIVIAGDFNDRCNVWDSDHANSELHLDLYNTNTSLNLTQVVHSPTCVSPNNESLLDLIFTDAPTFIRNVQVVQKFKMAAEFNMATKNHVTP